MWEAPHFDKKEAETEALTEVSIGKGKVKQSTQLRLSILINLTGLFSYRGGLCQLGRFRAGGKVGLFMS